MTNIKSGDDIEFKCTCCGGYKSCGKVGFMNFGGGMIEVNFFKGKKKKAIESVVLLRDDTKKLIEFLNNSYNQIEY